MPRLPSISLCALAAVLVTGCSLPRHHSQVMHGDVRGGDVPLYMTGTMGDFFKADLILPDTGGYFRLEYDVFDIGADGLISPALAAAPSPQAQIAFPRLVSSFDLDDGSQIRYAQPAEETPALACAAPANASAGPVTPTTAASSSIQYPASSPAPQTSAIRYRPSAMPWADNSYFQVSTFR